MTDIVERLRKWGDYGPATTFGGKDAREAADEIERLRERRAPADPDVETEAISDKALGSLIAKICSHGAVEDAMKVSWDDICTDTGCHPLDITRGKHNHLIFRANHWANQIAKRLFVKALKSRSEMLPADSELKAIVALRQIKNRIGDLQKLNDQATGDGRKWALDDVWSIAHNTLLEIERRRVALSNGTQP